MEIRTITLDESQLQALLNNIKDSVIERINNDCGTDIDPCEYLVLVRRRGTLGRMWDKLMGDPGDNASSDIVRVVLDKKP